MDYRKGSHTTYRLDYHFVWATKYRHRALTGDVAERVRELVRQTCASMEVHILSGVVSADHVHILVSAPPQWSPSEIMRRVKGRTAKKLFEATRCREDFPALKKRFWRSACLGAGLLLRDERRDDGGSDPGVPEAPLRAAGGG